MIHENARRAAFRPWLRFFAGIVAIAAGVSEAADTSGEIAATNRHSTAVFSATQSGRTPAAAFLTDDFVCELDTSLKAVRFWQRSDDGLELCWPKGADTAVPMSAETARKTGASRFLGITPPNPRSGTVGEGTQFKQPVGMDRERDGNRFAVVNAGEWIDKGDNKFSPSVQVYSVSPAGDGGAAVSFENEYKEAFYRAVSSSRYVISSIVDTSYWTTNVLDTFYTTNWIHVISENPFITVTNDTESADAGLIIATNTWEEAVYHHRNTTNYVWEYTYTTNANYLSTATDVAFLGDEGLVVSITADDRRTMPSGFIVFDLSDPSAKGALYPVSDLPATIGKIAVDPETGDIYASVPDAGAVYRYAAPGSGPGSWVSEAVKTDDIGVWLQDSLSRDATFVAGVEGLQGSRFGLLSNPGDLSVWYPSALDEPVILVADSSNNRIEAFDYAGTALFTFGTAGGISSDPFRSPKAVWGEPDADTFAVAESTGRRVRLFDPDLSGVDADSILSVSVFWPEAQAALIDTSITNGLAWRDALHTNAVDSVAVWVVESDDATNGIAFAVPPSRADRTYSISVEGADGVVEWLESETVVPAGRTQGVFWFRGFDGVVNADGSVPVYKAVIAAPSGETAETWIGVLNADPVISQAGLSGYDDINYQLDADGNIVPVAVFVPTGFAVEAEDVEADAGLRYLWFATSDFNWALNNLDWAVTNNAWEADAGTDWVLLNATPPGEEIVTTNWIGSVPNVPHVFAHEGGWSATDAYWLSYTGERTDYKPYVVENGVTNYFWISVRYTGFQADIEWTDREIAPPDGADWTDLYASWTDQAGNEHFYRPWDDYYDAKTNFFTINPRFASFFAAESETAAGIVTNGIDVYVASGKKLLFPTEWFGDMSTEGVVSVNGRIVVLTVLDKDGGSAIVTYGRQYPSASSVWVPVSGASAVYAAVFTAVSDTNVSFAVRVVSGTRAASDKLVLQSAETLGGPWKTLCVVQVGTLDFSGGKAIVDVPTDGTGAARFYRIVEP
ncbi:MAG: hypothetical protein IJV65_05330 [Kiritimatiellae bacterium]|nr:hypothetical protein [Kiritimatiellia bacterium]